MNDIPTETRIIKINDTPETRELVFKRLIAFCTGHNSMASEVLEDMMEIIDFKVEYLYKKERKG